jgi:hypothetical protein
VITLDWLGLYSGWQKRWVLITFYASEEVKARVERGDEYITGPDQLGLERVYFGRDERQAGLKFYQAVKKAFNMPLAFNVTVWRDNEVVVRVKIDH